MRCGTIALGHGGKFIVGMTAIHPIWRTRLTRREAIKLGLITALAPRALFGGNQQPWSFAVFSDTHYGVAGTAEKNDVLLREIAALSPAFAVDVGDLTERAWPFEFDLATRAFANLPYKVHVAPGNHDVRWAPRGPMLFEEQIGPMRQLIMHNGCAFLLLDSTVPLSHYGHIGGPQERWIRAQLQKLPAHTPVFVFLHHPVSRRAGVDDEARLLSALEGFNAKVVFTAHGHSDLIWDWNGITATMNKGLYQGSYQLVTVDPAAQLVRIARRTTEAPALNTIAEIPLEPRARPRAQPAPQTGSATGVARLAWSRPLGGGVMSELIVHAGTLYITCMDGSLYAFDADTGTQRWKATTGGYIHSTPTIVGEDVVVGSADGGVYAFQRRNGAQRWRVQTGGAVYASAARAQGVLAMASGDGSVYGLDARTGKQVWRYELDEGPSSFAQSPAATDGRQFFIGAWNEHVYALDAKTGRENWRYRATERGFYFSPAIARPAVGKGTLFIPSNDNTLHALETRTGKVLWKQHAPLDKFGYSSPLLVADRIYIGSLGDAGQVHCLNAADGALVWTCATGDTIYESSPVRVGDFIAIGSVSGLLSLVRMRDGQVAGTYRFPPGLFLSTAAAAGNRVFAATFAEQVAAIQIS
jgi:outer membrane protein assembly factor BamB